MAESVVITDQTHLEGVLGPLNEVDDRRIKARIQAASIRLGVLAAQINGHVGWHGQGLELNWMPSGQTSIATFVGVTDPSGQAVSFLVELRPGWFYGKRTGTPSWEVEVTVEVDCQHADDHGSMHQVFERSTTASDPELAVCLT